MAFLSKQDIEKIGFARVGLDVLISDRAVFHEPERQEIGDYSRIDDFCVVSGQVSLGRNVHLAVFCNVAGGHQGIKLGDFSGLAYGCTIFTQSDDYSGVSLTNPTIPREFKEESFAAVSIGRHAILGTHCVVLPGVDIAEGCALAAMTLANRSTEPWGIYGGIPARRVRDRSRELLEKEERFLSSLSSAKRRDPE